MTGNVINNESSGDRAFNNALRISGPKANLEQLEQEIREFFENHRRTIDYKFLDGYGALRREYSLEDFDLSTVTDSSDCIAISLLQEKGFTPATMKFTGGIWKGYDPPRLTVLVIPEYEGQEIVYMDPVALLYEGHLYHQETIDDLHQKLTEKYVDMERGCLNNQNKQDVERARQEPSEMLIRLEEAWKLLDRDLHRLHQDIVLVGLLADKNPLESLYGMARARANLASSGFPQIAVKRCTQHEIEMIFPVHQEGGIFEPLPQNMHQYPINGMEDLIYDCIESGIYINHTIRCYTVAHNDWAIDYRLFSLTISRQNLEAFVPFLKVFINQVERTRHNRHWRMIEGENVESSDIDSRVVIIRNRPRWQIETSKHNTPESADIDWEDFKARKRLLGSRSILGSERIEKRIKTLPSDFCILDVCTGTGAGIAALLPILNRYNKTPRKIIGVDAFFSNVCEHLTPEDTARILCNLSLPLPCPLVIVQESVSSYLKRLELNGVNPSSWLIMGFAMDERAPIQKILDFSKGAHLAIFTIPSDFPSTNSGLIGNAPWMRGEDGWNWTHLRNNHDHFDNFVIHNLPIA